MTLSSNPGAAAVQAPSPAATADENGPAIRVFEFLFAALHRASLVEFLKWAAAKIWAPGSRRLTNLVIDLFVLGKWILVLVAWYAGWQHVGWVLFVSYLLLMNLETYFWYHLWHVEPVSQSSTEPRRDRRRFINLCSAVAFSMVCYAYLYHRVMPTQFTWKDGVAPWAASLKYSIGNALTGATGDLTPITTTSYMLTTSQLVMTVVFISMLMSNSLPKVRI